MKLDAAWLERYLVALAVVFGGMFAVSAQCGCCHHCLQCFSDMPLLVRYLLFFFLFCCSFSGFLILLPMILHGLILLCLCLSLFILLMLHGVCVMETMGYVLMGGLIPLFMYHHLFCVSSCPYDIYT